MIHNNTLYLSRSAIEDYLSCNQYYYYLYHHPDKDGIERGVHPAKPIRALELGTAAHKAVEFLMRRLMLKQKMEEAKQRTGIEQQLPDIDVNTELFKIISNHIMLKFKTPDSTPDTIWTIRNDVALVYGLVLMFKATLMDEIEGGHKVLGVEEEYSRRLPLISNIVSAGLFHPTPVEVVMESRPDWITIDTETGDLIVWNLKTSNTSLTDDSRVDRSFTHDLQGLVESWAVEQGWAEIKWAMERLPDQLRVLVNVGVPMTVNGVRYAFLVKGKDEAKKNPQTGEYEGKYWTHSAVVRGWKNQVGDRVRYAWDNQIEKPENKSGFGFLGKDWELFSVWEEPSLGGSIKERVENWVRLLMEDVGDIQPETSPRLVQVPDDKIRSEEDKNGITQELKEIGESIVSQLRGERMWFKNRKRCTYPFKCKYFEWCREGKDIKGAIERGELVGREPNHPKEGTGLVQIRNERKEKELQ